MPQQSSAILWKIVPRVPVVSAVGSKVEKVAT
jgi:hypothetical protein